MGLRLGKEKKDSDALRELKQAVANDPTYPEPYYVMGRIYRRNGDQTQADAEWSTFQKLKKEKVDERPH